MGRVNESSKSYVNAEVKIKAVVVGVVKSEGTIISSTLIIIQKVCKEAFQRAGSEHRWLVDREQCQIKEKIIC